MRMETDGRGDFTCNQPGHFLTGLTPHAPRPKPCHGKPSGSENRTFWVRPCQGWENSENCLERPGTERRRLGGFVQGSWSFVVSPFVLSGKRTFLSPPARLPFERWRGPSALTPPLCREMCSCPDQSQPMTSLLTVSRLERHSLGDGEAEALTPHLSSPCG